MKNDPHQYEVIVIGAGAAGLAAAQDLHAHGIKDVLIIEARDRIGGRVWTVSPWGVATDLGASWIHDINNNPVAALAKKYGIDTIPTIYESEKLAAKFTSYDIYDNYGKKISPADMHTTLELINKFNKAIEQATLNLKANTSYADAITAFAQQEDLQTSSLQLLTFILRLMLECEFAADLKQISVTTTNSIVNLNGKDVLPSGGYGRVFSELTKDLELILNNPVTKIDYSKDQVTVTTKKAVYNAKYAIVTLPLGVLQSDTIQFIPQLPAIKRAAIKNLRMGFFNKVYLLFEKPFWDPVIEWIAAMPDKNNQNVSYEIFNLYKYMQQPILAVHTVGSFAAEAEGWGDQKIVDYFMSVLKLIYSNDIARPSAYLITRWGKDPFACGSYSYPSVTCTREDYDALSAAVANKLFFAGEATNADNSSTVHGAYLSGVAAAQMVYKAGL